MFGWHGNTFPKWNKCLAVHVLSKSAVSLWPCGTFFFLITGRAGSIDHCLWKALDLNIWTSCWEYPAARTTKDINTKQYYHLLPINCAVVMSSVTKLSLGFPGCFFFFGQVLCRWYNYSVIPYLPSNNITSYFNSNDFWSWWQIVLKWPKVFIAAFYWFLC